MEAGAGVWLGAFVDGRLVSQLGVLRAGAGLGRYQDVETHPEFRRQGLAGALVAMGGAVMVDDFGTRTLVMVADPDDEAIRLYRSLGFVESEHLLEASLSPTRRAAQRRDELVDDRGLRKVGGAGSPDTADDGTPRDGQNDELAGGSDG